MLQSSCGSNDIAGTAYVSDTFCSIEGSSGYNSCDQYGYGGGYEHTVTETQTEHNTVTYTAVSKAPLRAKRTQF